MHINNYRKINTDNLSSSKKSCKSEIRQCVKCQHIIAKGQAFEMTDEGEFVHLECSVRKFAEDTAKYFKYS